MATRLSILEPRYAPQILVRIIVLIVLAAALGGLNGLISAGMLHFLTWAIRFLWGTLTATLPLPALILATFGGLLVGLGRRYLGDYPKPLEPVTQTALLALLLVVRILPSWLVCPSEFVEPSGRALQSPVKGRGHGLFQAWLRAFEVEVFMVTRDRILPF